MPEEIPVYKIAINEEDDRTGVKVVSFVDAPAIESGFIALSKQEGAFTALADDVKQIITGPALIPDIEILRISEDGYPYKIVFSKEAIESIAKKFFKEKNTDATNFQHEEALEGNFIVESWIIQNSDNDKARALGMDLPEGTWMLSYYVPDREVYNALKSEATGFSIEGRFILDEQLQKIEEKMSKSNLFNKVMAALKPLFLAEDCETCGDGEETKETMGTNLSEALISQINAWAEVAGLSKSEADAQIVASSGLTEERYFEIVDGSAQCPTTEEVQAIAGAFEGSDLDALLNAWEADGCGAEEAAKEEKPEETKEAEVAQGEHLSDLEEKLADVSAKLSELEAQLAQKVAIIAEKDAEITELKKQPAGKPVVSTPAKVEEIKQDLSALPFHKRFISNLKKISK